MLINLVFKFKYYLRDYSIFYCILKLYYLSDVRAYFS